MIVLPHTRPIAGRVACTSIGLWVTYMDSGKAP